MPLDLLIIGGGPAALTASIYARRSGLSCSLIEKEQIGGQISDSPKVENFPGFELISGLDLANKMFEQTTALGTGFEMDDIQAIEPKQGGFALKGLYGTYESKAVILATGVKHRKLGIPGEDRLLGHGVSYCAVCDGAFYQGQPVTVIGDANSALQYALLLSSSCPEVHLDTLFDKFFAEEALVQAILKTPNIIVRHNLAAQSFEGDKELDRVVYQDTVSKETIISKTSAVFVAIGQVPDNERFAKVVELSKGFIVADEDLKTKTPGIFAAGDARVKKVRQLTTAASDGAIAALSASLYVKSHQS